MNDPIQNLDGGQSSVSEWSVTAVELIKDYAEGVDIALLSPARLIARNVRICCTQQLRGTIKQH